MSISVMDLRRHAGIVAAFSYSGANFLLAFTLQRLASAEDFGVFALIQVALQFGVSLSNAVFCAPLVVVLSKGANTALLTSFLRANAIFCVVGAAIVATVICICYNGPELGLAAGALTLLSWSRWFLRSVELANRNFLASAMADLLYSATVGVPAFVLLVHGTLRVEEALWLQAIGSASAFLTIGAAVRRRGLLVRRASIRPFAQSLRQYGGWATLGVVTTEATANAHAWIVGFFISPRAFAPIAAVTLFFRPVLITTQALTQYERPRMAKAIKDGSRADLLSCCNFFSRISLACLCLNAAVIAAILGCFPRLIGNGQYPKGELWMLATVITLTYLARVLRGAGSAALQAGGSFRSLAMTTIATAPVAVALVGASVAMPSPSPALLMVGVLVAEALSCVLIRRDKRRFVALEVAR